MVTEANYGLWGPIIKQKDYVDNWESPCSLKKETMKVIKKEDLKAAILACIHITNVNLININNRLQDNTREVKKVILQSDAIAVFKGNMIRVLKQLYDSPTINIIKSRMSYTITLNDIHPVINGICIVWPELPDYRGESYKRVRRDIIEEFLAITNSEINDQAILAFKQVESKVIHISKSLSFNSVNFDSVNNIKFTVK